MHQHKAVWLFGLCLMGLLAMPQGIQAQDAAHLGTDFWLAFPENYFDGAELYVQSDQPAQFTVTIVNPTFSFTGTVTPGTPKTVNLPALVEIRTNQVVENKGIHVTSDQPISVKFRSPVPAGQADDAYLGLPTTALGTEYILLAYQESLSSRGFPGTLGPSEFVVVATENNTNVTFTTTCTSLGGTPAGTTIALTLNQGQTYQYQCGNKGDVTGAMISSDKPIGVFGGNKCADLPPKTAYCDYLVEQAFPITLWGKDYLTFPLSNGTADLLRILASQDGTTITLDDGVSPTTIALHRGKFVDFTAAQATHITSTQPILVAQYGRGAAASPYNANRDPLMLQIIPTDLFLREHRLFIPTGYSPDFVNIITPATAVSTVRLDGQPVSGFSPLPGGKYHGVAVSVTDGEHVLTAAEPIGVYAYGFKSYGSYGYPAGIAFPKPAVFSQVKVIDTISTVNIALDTASFSKPPFKTTTATNQTLIEWRFETFQIGQTEHLSFEVILKNLVPGENRLVNHQLEVVYLDPGGQEVRTGTGPQYVRVLQSAFDSTISTDKPSYQANENVQISGSIKNLSGYSRTIDAKVLIEDSQGVLVQEVATLAGLSFAAGETKPIGPLLWNTGSTLAGDYKAHLMLYENQKPVGEATAHFTIQPVIALTSKVVTDKISYQAHEPVTLTATVINDSLNVILENVQAVVTILDPGGATLFTDSRTLPLLVPGATSSYPVAWNTGTSPPGSYTARLVATHPLVSAQATTTFTVLSTAGTGAGLVGTLTAQPNPVYQGKDETLSYTVINQGNEALTILAVRVLIVNPDTQEIKQTFERTVTLPLNGTAAGNFLASTATLSPRIYLAILQAQAPTMPEPKTLASAPFEVKPGLEVAKTIPDLSKVLVWLNYAWTAGQKTPGRAAIEQALQEAGVEYQIVLDKKDVGTELRNPYYTDFLILGDQQPLEDHFSEELREQVYSGKGLIASLFNRQNLDAEVLGMTFTGALSGSDYPVELLQSEIAAAGTFPSYGKALKVEALNPAETIAWIVETTAKGTTKYPGILKRQYGQGKVLFFAFDLGMSTPSYSPFASILKNSLSYIHKPLDPTGFYPYHLVPVAITLKSLGGAFDLKITETYPAEVKLYDPVTNQWITQNPWVRNVQLNPGESKTLLYDALTPDQAGTYTLQTEVGYLEGGTYTLYQTLSVDLVVEKTANTMTGDVLTALKALTVTGLEKAKVNEAIKYVENVQQRVIATDQDIEQNIRDLLKAIDALLFVTSTDVSQIRLLMDELLKVWESRYYL
jgi:hypothetical protein